MLKTDLWENALVSSAKSHWDVWLKIFPIPWTSSTELLLHNISNYNSVLLSVLRSCNFLFMSFLKSSVCLSSSVLIHSTPHFSLVAMCSQAHTYKRHSGRAMQHNWLLWLCRSWDEPWEQLHSSVIRWHKTQIKTIMFFAHFLPCLSRLLSTLKKKRKKKMYF